MSLTTRTRRRRRETTRPFVVVGSAMVVIAAATLFAAIALHAPQGIPLLGYKTVYANVPSTGNLRIHSEVRSAGARVGEVVAVDTAPGGRARLTMKFDPGANFAADTTASVRGKGLLGARFVDLTPGRSAKRLVAGGTIREGKNPLTLSVNDALETFDVQTRGALHTSVDELGKGVAARGRDLNRALRDAPPAADDFLPATDLILTDRPALQRLLPDLAGASATVDASRDQLTRLFTTAPRALAPVNAKRDDIRTTIGEAPGTLDVARPALDTGRGLLTSVRSVASAASATLPAAPASLRATTALLREAPVPLDKANGLLEQLHPTVPAVLQVTKALDPVLPLLTRGSDDLAAIAAVLGPGGCDLSNFAENWRSVLNQGASSGGTEIGPLTAFRVNVLAGPEVVAGLGAKAPQSTERDPAHCKYSSPPPSYGLGDNDTKAGS